MRATKMLAAEIVPSRGAAVLRPYVVQLDAGLAGAEE
jgi:hypothetical protein